MGQTIRQAHDAAKQPDQWTPFRRNLIAGSQALTQSQVRALLEAVIANGYAATLYDVRDGLRAFDVEVMDY